MGYVPCTGPELPPPLCQHLPALCPISGTARLEDREQRTWAKRWVLEVGTGGFESQLNHLVSVQPIDFSVPHFAYLEKRNSIRSPYDRAFVRNDGMNCA